MKPLSQIVLERAEEQAMAIEIIAPRERDPGPMQVDKHRYKLQVYYGSCRWCGARRKQAAPVCRVCRKKQKPCEDCGGAIGYRYEGEQCYHCRKLDIDAMKAIGKESAYDGEGPKQQAGKRYHGAGRKLMRKRSGLRPSKRAASR